jgi:hypothetical protein
VDGGELDTARISASGILSADVSVPEPTDPEVVVAPKFCDKSGKHELESTGKTSQFFFASDSFENPFGNEGVDLGSLFRPRLFNMFFNAWSSSSGSCGGCSPFSVMK